MRVLVKRYGASFVDCEVICLTQVPARAQATMGPAASGAVVVFHATAVAITFHVQVCPSNLELAALAAVAANLTSKRGVPDVSAHGTAVRRRGGLLVGRHQSSFSRPNRSSKASTSLLLQLQLVPCSSG